MDSPQAAQLQWLRDLHGGALKALSDWIARFSGYVMIGNGGAIVLLLNAIVSGTSCDLPKLTWILTLLLLALVIAYVGVALSWVVGQNVLQKLSDAINQMALIETHKFNIEALEAKIGASLPDDNPLPVALTAAEKELEGVAKRIADAAAPLWISIAVFGLSIVVFGVAMVTPLLDGGDLIRSCAGAFLPDPIDI